MSPVPPADPAARLRIAVIAHGDPESPSTWSGTPAGIIAGLRAGGHEVVGVSASARPHREKRVLQLLALAGLPRELRAGGGLRTALTRAVARARNTRAYRLWSTLLATTRLRRAGRVDLVVRLGSAFSVPRGPAITYDDLTIPQVLRRASPDWKHLSAATVRSRVRAQRRACLTARAVTVATPWTGRSVRDDLAVPERLVHAVGVGVPALPDPVDRDFSVPRFLFVGKNWEQKDGPVLLAAFALVRRELPAAELHLVGHHPEIEEPQVTGHGFLRRDDPAAQRRLAELYARSTCLVVPTRFEAAGIAFLEAASAGIPSIGSAGCGAADIIGPGGVVCEPGDPRSLAAAMLQVADPVRARDLGAAGRSRAARFTWQQVGARMLQAAGEQPVRRSDWEHLFDAPAPRVDSPATPREQP